MNGQHEQGWGGVPPKHYRVGEVVGFTGLSRQTLHNYTVMGLIREHGRTQGGQRLYNASVFATLSRIEAMKRRKMTLAEIRELLQASGTTGRMSPNSPEGPIQS